MHLVKSAYLGVEQIEHNRLFSIHIHTWLIPRASLANRKWRSTLSARNVSAATVAGRKSERGGGTVN